MSCPMRRSDFVPVVAVIGSALYPLLVYFGLPHVPPGALVVFATGLAVLGLLRRGDEPRILPRWSIVLIPCVLLALLALRPLIAVQAYPPLINTSMAVAFAWSLLNPPSAIERIARLTNPALSPDAVAYTRTVTKVWTIFFLANAIIVSITAIWCTVAAWSLWILISYALMGVLFVGEAMARRRLSHRAVL
jgi:uncharacterized membrane protein